MHLGPYEILGPLGSGGMGDVYRARDPRLGREVAIKVVPAAFSTDVDRLRRFEREARLLAALNHPNIAHIHGFEDSTGTPALVMELVNGPTLADPDGQWVGFFAQGKLSSSIGQQSQFAAPNPWNGSGPVPT